MAQGTEISAALAADVDRLMPAAWEAYVDTSDEIDDHPTALRAALAAALRELHKGEAERNRAARERLARHLFVTYLSLSPDAAKLWDTGQVSPRRMDGYRRAADRALAVIAGNEA